VFFPFLKCFAETDCTKKENSSSGGEKSPKKFLSKNSSSVFGYRKIHKELKAFTDIIFFLTIFLTFPISVQF